MTHLLSYGLQGRNYLSNMASPVFTEGVAAHVTHSYQPSKRVISAQLWRDATSGNPLGDWRTQSSHRHFPRKLRLSHEYNAFDLHKVFPDQGWLCQADVFCLALKCISPNLLLVSYMDFYNVFTSVGFLWKDFLALM